MPHSVSHRREAHASRRPDGRWRPALLLILLLAFSLCAHAAAPRTADTAPPLPAHQMVWRQWTVAEGLPQITINDMLQDRAGYLWIATQDGIARFDGVAFRNYMPADNPGLGHNVVTALTLDRDGALWMGTMSGVARFIGGRIVPVRIEGSGMVMGMRPHPGGGVWVAAENGLYHAVGRAATRVTGASERMPMVTVLQPADGPELAVGPFHLVIDPRGARRVVPLKGRVPAVLSAALAADGGLWLGTVSGLYRTDRDGNPRGAPIEAGRGVQSVAQAPDGTVWIGSDQGLSRYRPGAAAVERVTVPGIGRAEWITRLYVDRERNLWVGTQLTGLHRAAPGRFRRITARDGLVDDAVWSIYEAPDGELWAGTPDGLYRGGLQGFRQAVDGLDLPHPNVIAVLRDHRGGLWIGTFDGLAHQPAGAARPRPVGGIGGGAVSALLEEDNGGILVGALAGLYRLRDGRAQRIELPGQDGGMNVTGLARGRDGRLWVGYDAGVAYRDGDRWLAAGGPGDRGPGTGVLAPFDAGVLVAGMDGFYYVDARSTRKLGLAEGLHMDTVHSALVDAAAVWYQTPRGVGRIPADQLRALLHGERRRVDARVFGDLDSAQFAQCNGGQQDAGALTRGRWLWCPSLQGLLALDLTRTDELAPPPRARLQMLATPHRRIDLATARGALALRPDERDLQIDYTGLSLRAGDRLAFHGRLRGYDAQWQALGHRRTAYYTNLPAGEYTYALYATNPDGVRGPVAQLAFEIRPHWYETAAARVGAVLALLLLAWGALRWRLRALHQRREVLEARVRQRTRELEEANQKLQAASLTDPLTGLHNRRYLLQHLPHEVARVDRLHEADGAAADAVLAFVHIDLDRFKQINDACGHHVGDQVLRTAADLLRETTRAADFVLRWGGEEFLLVGRDMERADIAAWAERIGERFRRHVFETEAGPLHVTCSIGHAVYPALTQGSAGPGWEGVLNLADAATYLAKREGRDRSIGFELMRDGLPDDFATRLHHEPQALAAEGWILIVRGVASADASAPHVPA